MTDGNSLPFNEEMVPSPTDVEYKIQPSSSISPFNRIITGQSDNKPSLPQHLNQGTHDYRYPGKPVRPLERTFPDKNIQKIAKGFHPLAQILDEAVINLEFALSKVGEPFSISAIERFDPEEPEIKHRVLRIRIPNVPQAERLRLWENFVDTFDESVEQVKAKSKSAELKRSINRYADSVFIELDMG